MNDKIEMYKKLYTKSEKHHAQFTIEEFVNWCLEWDIITAQLKTKLK